MALVPFPSVTPGDDEDDDSQLDDSGSKMSFLEHLDELRKRLIYIVWSLLAGCIVAYFFIQRLVDFIMRPMQRLLPAGQTLIYTDPSEAFMLEIKIGLIVGAMIASPLVFTQVWLFIAPGLYSHEKRWAIPFVAMSSVLFIVGAAFSHYLVFPIVWRFFTSFTTD